MIPPRPVACCARRDQIPVPVACCFRRGLELARLDRELDHRVQQYERLIMCHMLLCLRRHDEGEGEVACFFHGPLFLLIETSLERVPGWWISIACACLSRRTGDAPP